MTTRVKPLAHSLALEATLRHNTMDPRQEMGNCVALTMWNLIDPVIHSCIYALTFQIINSEYTRKSTQALP